MPRPKTLPELLSITLLVVATLIFMLVIDHLRQPALDRYSNYMMTK